MPPLRNSAEVHTGEVLGIEPRSAHACSMAAVVVGAHADGLAAGAAEGEASDLTTPPEPQLIARSGRRGSAQRDEAGSRTVERARRSGVGITRSNRLG